MSADAGTADRRTSLLPWLMWGLAALYYGSDFLQRVAPSIMVDSLMRDFRLDGTGMGTLAAAYFYAYAAAQVPMGLLLDRFGARRMLAVAALLTAVGSSLFAVSQSLTLAIPGRALVGIGGAVAYVGALKLASMWFPKERFGLLAGLTLGVGTAGAIGAQVPLGIFVAAHGWRPTMVAASGIALVFAAAMAIFLRDAPGGAAVRQQKLSGIEILRQLGALLRSRDIWILFCVTGFIGGPILTYVSLWGVPSLVQGQGLSRPQAGSVTSVMLAAWAIGGPLSGWLSDRMGRRRPVLIGGTALMLAGWLAVIALPVEPLVLLVPLLAVTGLASGCMVVAFAYARDRFGLATAGTAVAVVNTSVLLVGAAMQTLVGSLLDLRWIGGMAGGARLYGASDYRFAFATFAVSALAALVAAWALNERKA